MPIDAATRAERIWVKIQRNPTSVIFTKPRVVSGTGTVTPETQLASQTVRIASDNRASVVEGVAGAAPKRNAIVFGIRDHATLTDTDMAEGYTFDHEGDHYRCTDVILVPGGKQGVFVVNG